MGKRPTHETLGDLLLTVIEERRFTAWCEAAGLRSQTVSKLLDGETMPRRATVIALAKALGVDAARVRKAIEASRAAAEA